jgi:hypothetical protein
MGKADAEAGTPMVLTFDDRGLLPPGIHEATLDEVEEHFARFQRSDRRIRLFDRLRAYLKDVKRAACATCVLIDGSFVMAGVDEPDDIDLILVLPPDWDLAADLKPYQYNLVSKRRVRQEYGIEVYPVRPGSVEEQKWVAFFHRVNIKWCQQFGWPSDSTKGIVRVAL